MPSPTGLLTGTAHAPGRARGPVRLLVAVLLVAAVAWLGFRSVRAFDQDRHAAAAAAVLAAPDTVTHRLPPVQLPDPAGRGSPPPADGGTPERASPPPADGGAPDGRASPPSRDGGAPEREGSRQPEGGRAAVHTPGPTGASGWLSYRPGTWLSVIDLRGLDPVTGDERYLVFLRNWAGWTLAGAARPGPDGTAQVRSGAEPRSVTIYEVVVTRAVDDATSVPHGQPLLHWFDASIAPPDARRFDFAAGA
jgi:hypothetical protein